MNINIYLEESLGKALNHYAKQFGKPRNAIIRDALKEWVLNHQVKQWPKSILQFKGISDAPSFESLRDDLTPPKENPFE